MELGTTSIPARSLINYTHRIALALERMAIAGAIVDSNEFGQIAGGLDSTLRRTSTMLVTLAAQHDINPFSPTNDNHLRKLLFEKLGLRPLSRTATGLPSVKQADLKLMDHEVVQAILEYNRVQKLYSVNVEGMGELLKPVGVRGDGLPIQYLPFHINPLGARTGRRSSTKPNSQNWPESMKRIVVSRWPGGSILNADYKKLEVVLIAWIAGDDKLLQYFTRGNGYVDVARELFSTDVAEGTKEYTAVKSIVLGVHYNMQTDLMAKNLWLLGIRFSPDAKAHWEETDRLRKLYLRRFSGIGRYMEQRKAFWLSTGESINPLGRVRHLPVPDRGEHGYGHSLNQAINFPVQSMASEVMGSALLDIEEALCREAGCSLSEYYRGLIEQRENLLTRGWDSGIILPISQLFNEVHDAVVADLRPETAVRDRDIIIECMRAVRSLKQLLPEFDASILDADFFIEPFWRSKKPKKSA